MTVPLSAVAGGTDPTLALSSAKAVAAGPGLVGVQVRGTFEFDDLVQGAIPAGLIVFQANRFVRFDVAGTVAQGTAAAVTDGVTAGDVDLLIASGGPSPGASLGSVGADGILCTLPSSYLTSGNASAVIYVLVEGETFVSNTVNFQLP